MSRIGFPLIACGVLIMSGAGTTLASWFLAGAVVSAVVLSIPLGIQRYRAERKLARTLWTVLTQR